MMKINTAKDRKLWRLVRSEEATNSIVTLAVDFLVPPGNLHTCSEPSRLDSSFTIILPQFIRRYGASQPVL
jgi:hypothetical protein